MQNEDDDGYGADGADEDEVGQHKTFNRSLNERQIVTLAV